jgi:hypothetical protein
MVRSQKDVEEVLAKCEKLLERGVSNSADKQYLETVRDVLDWMLGNADHPLQDYK